MGCATSKGAVAATPTPELVYAGPVVKRRYGRKKVEEEEEGRGSDISGSEFTDSRRGSSTGVRDSFSSTLGSSLRGSTEAELVAAGWPPWLCSVAGEAVHGWVPLRADSFQKLEKIGQGTYSSVFRACHIETGRIVALKKVRFDNYDPESIRFTTREISILRRLDHPNIIKLEGVVGSHLSSTMYLVFEYMEHDLTGLSASPDVTLTEPQIKCYMKQLLCGLEHCHSLGVMHRDIKGSNLLVNNQGILKIADFGLANYVNSMQPLTSRVVTLWYRPPELLLGSTFYGSSVDLWSVGCVLSEIFLGKPILQGRTEVEQLHKIFKLCGSPKEEYWKKLTIPHLTLVKPHTRYPSMVREACSTFPAHAGALVETLLSVEPSRRGTAASVLSSTYFRSRPYACDPWSLPGYPPKKEIDVKALREGSKKKEGRRVQLQERGGPTRERAEGNKLQHEDARSQTMNRVPRNTVHLLKEGDMVLHSGELSTSFTHVDLSSSRFESGRQRFQPSDASHASHQSYPLPEPDPTYKNCNTEGCDRVLEAAGMSWFRKVSGRKSNDARSRRR